MEHGDGVVLEVAPFIFDERVGGRCLDMAGQAVDRLELHPCQRPVAGHEFVSLIFTHSAGLSLLPQSVYFMHRASSMLAAVVGSPFFGREVISAQDARTRS